MVLADKGVLGVFGVMGVLGALGLAACAIALVADCARQRRDNAMGQLLCGDEKKKKGDLSDGCSTFEALEAKTMPKIGTPSVETNQIMFLTYEVLKGSKEAEGCQKPSAHQLHRRKFLYDCCY